MLAIPLDTNEATILSELYGKAPYFALLDLTTGSHKVVENKECGNGLKSAEYLKDLGVKSTIFFHMGEGVYKACAKNGIDVYTSKKEPLSIDSIYTKALNGSFKKLNSENYNVYLDAGSEPCTCGCASR